MKSQRSKRYLLYQLDFVKLMPGVPGVRKAEPGTDREKPNRAPQIPQICTDSFIMDAEPVTTAAKNFATVTVPLPRMANTTAFLDP